MAKRILCNITLFTAQRDGIGAIQQHSNSVRHTSCVKEKMQSQTVLNFVQEKNHWRML